MSIPYLCDFIKFLKSVNQGKSDSSRLSSRSWELPFYKPFVFMMLVKRISADRRMSDVPTVFFFNAARMIRLAQPMAFNDIRLSLPTLGFVLARLMKAISLAPLRKATQLTETHKSCQVVQPPEWANVSVIRLTEKNDLSVQGMTLCFRFCS